MTADIFTAEPAPVAEPEKIHTDQARIAYRVADQHDGKLMYVFGIGWHHFDGKRWVEDQHGIAKRYVLETVNAAMHEAIDRGDNDLLKDAKKCNTSFGVRGVLDIASALRSFAVTVEDLDDDPYLLNLNNGTLDLRTMELKPHTPTDRITKVCRGSWQQTPDGDWKAFIEQILPDPEVRSFVQRYVGMSLLGEVRDHKLCVWHGEGRNGKGIAYGAIAYALGNYARSVDADLLTPNEGAHPAAQMDLLGVRFAVVSETPQGKHLNESVTKRLTGGDTINARRMHSNPVTFEPSHSVVMVTNFLPTVSGDDPAIWSRLLLVPFTFSAMGNEDTTLKARMELAADEVLAWCIQGWREYDRQGLDPPPVIANATAEYRSDSDTFGTWMSDSCDRQPILQSPLKTLYEHYMSAMRHEGYKPMTKPEFKKTLAKRGMTFKNGTGNALAVIGIQIKPEESSNKGDWQ